MDALLAPIIQLGIGGILLALLIRGDLVPKSTNEREITRGDDATKSATANAEALRSVTTALVAVSTEISKLASDIKDIRNDIAILKGSIR